MGAASLVMGILSIVFTIFSWFPYAGAIALILGIGGIVLGAISSKDSGVGKAGMIISIIAVALYVVMWLACAACVASL